MARGELGARRYQYGRAPPSGVRGGDSIPSRKGAAASSDSCLRVRPEAKRRSTRLRLFHAAGLSIVLRQYPCGQELTEQMLRDVDRWIIEQITAGADRVG